MKKKQMTMPLPHLIGLAIRFLKFGLTLVGVQAISAVAAIVLARNLPPSEYALITIFVIAQGAANILSSGATCLIASAKIGVLWGSRSAVSKIISHGNKIQAVTMIAFVPILCVIAADQYEKAGADAEKIATLTALFMATIAIEQSSRLQSIVIQFDGEQVYLQLLELIASSIRATTVLLLAHFARLGLEITLAVYACAGIPKLILIRRRAAAIIGDRPVDKLDRQSVVDMNSFVARHIANDIFLCAQPQLTLVATTQYGTAYATAALGALSRIGQLFTPIYVALAAFLIPRFSKQKIELANTYLKVVLLAVLPASVLLLMAAAAPDAILALLGPHYVGLNRELMIAAIGFSIYAWLNFCWQLLLNRGHNKYSWSNIPSALVLGVATFSLVDKTTLAGALWIQLSMATSIAIPLALELAHIAKTGAWSGNNAVQ